MEINGKKLQEKLLAGLRQKIDNLHQKGITPGIGIVTLGPEETWEAYVGQKIKLAKALEITTRLLNLRPKTTNDVLKAIETLNSKNTIHGLIVQRPFPIHIDTERIIQSVSKYKDIDGFRIDSYFEVPVWMAVRHLIAQASQLLDTPKFQLWLSNQSILVVGRGETAGQPVINGLRNLNIEPQIIDSKTLERDKLFAKADVIIFATGKRISVPFSLLKKNSILIGIGLHRRKGKLVGDFDEIEARNNVLYYTPSPGGVGPLNLYFLFENLVKAAENSIDTDS